MMLSDQSLEDGTTRDAAIADMRAIAMFDESVFGCHTHVGD